MRERHWHLITDDELAELLSSVGCDSSRVEHLVKNRDTLHAEDEISMTLSKPLSES